MSVTETGTRARQPDDSGFARSGDGLRLYWELYGGGSTTIVLLPPNPISHSRIWKAQIHFLARHFRVVAYDGRGNGNSDNPDPGEAWLKWWWAADCLAVMDATATEKAILTGICSDGVWPSVQVAAKHPERMLGIVAIAPGVPLISPPHPFRRSANQTFEEKLENPTGMGEVQSALHDRELPRLPRVLLWGDVSRAALDQAGRGRRGVRP